MTGRKDCACPRARHEHGTPTGYTSCGCKCLPCRVAYAEQNQARRHGQRANAERTWPYVPAIGTARRIQALHAVGWSGKEIADRMGVTIQYVHKLRTSLDRIMPATAARVAEIYDELWDKQPPTETRGQRQAATYARSNAKRHGWAVPMAWNDEELDDPNGRPHDPGNIGWELQPCGTPAAYTRHRRKGEPIDAACREANRLASAQRKGRAA